MKVRGVTAVRWRARRGFFGKSGAGRRYPGFCGCMRGGVVRRTMKVRGVTVVGSGVRIDRRSLRTRSPSREAMWQSLSVAREGTTDYVRKCIPVLSSSGARPRHAYSHRALDIASRPAFLENELTPLVSHPDPAGGGVFYEGVVDHAADVEIAHLGWIGGGNQRHGVLELIGFDDWRHAEDFADVEVVRGARLLVVAGAVLQILADQLQGERLVSFGASNALDDGIDIRLGGVVVSSDP